MQNRQLQTWLSDDEYAQIEAEWQEQLALRETFKDKPSELKRYEEKLKEAIMMRNRSDAYHRKGNKTSAYKLDSKCESLCEDALEILQEIVQYDASLQIWFDRELDFGHGSLIDASIGNLPRIVTSRSIDKKRGDIRLASKQSVKLAVVERAMHNIGRDAAPSQENSTQNAKKKNEDVHKRRDEISKLVEFSNKSFFHEFGLEYVLQPPCTLGEDLTSTLHKYSLGSRALSVGDKNDNRVHDQSDRNHMNDEFGKLFLEALFANLEQKLI